MDIQKIAKAAKEASLGLLGAGEEIKNKALKNVHDEIKAKKEEIFEANKKDLKEAKEL